MIRKRSIPLLYFSLLAGLTGEALSAPFGLEKQISPAFRQWSTYGSRLGLDYNSSGAGIGVWNDSNPVTLASDRIFGQRLQADGTPASATFVVNASDGDVVEDAAVGIDAQGNSVMVWKRTLATGRNTVRARRFNAQGQALGGEIVVHSNVNSEHYDPEIAVRPDGRFIVTWSSGVLDGFGDVFVRQFNAAGLPEGPEVVANTNTAYGQVNPAIALAPDGSFAVAWEASGIRLGTDIAYRVFDSAGVAASDEIFVNTDFYTGDQRNPAIARNASGLTAIAWDCYACDSDDWGIRTKFFDAAGVPATGEFVVNQYIADNQVTPAALVDADGKVLLAWSSEHLSEGRTSIDARYFRADGTPIGNEFGISQPPSPGSSGRLQVNPVTTLDPSGLHRVGWTAYGAQAAQTGAYLARAYAADAGPDRTISAHNAVVDLAGSTYSGAPVAAWQWTQLSGPPVLLQRADEPNAQFTPPFENSTLAFQLSVRFADGTETQDLTQVHVDVDSPEVDAGMDQVTGEQPSLY